jgi:hypothetical protein
MSDLPLVTTQTCRTCGEAKPLTEFDLRSDTGKRRTTCKACRRAYQRTAKGPSRRRAFRIVGAEELLLCRRCGALKPWTEFPQRGRESDRLHSWCKECFAAYKAERHQANHEREMRRIRRNHASVIAANRERVLEYLLSHPCVDCGETDPLVLDFDHVRGEKLRDVSALVRRGYPWRTIEAEIAKCDVRCSNDHRRVTSIRRKSGAALAEEGVVFDFGDPGETRTPDQHFRRVLLYPLSYGVLGDMGSRATSIIPPE